jgi:hypothetical protein
MKVAYLFLERKNKRPIAGLPYVSSGEMEKAREILANIAFEDVSSFLDYALERARTTNYDPQSLAAIVRYLEPFLASQERRSAAKSAHSARERREAETKAYESYCYTLARGVLAALPSEERSEIERLAKQGSSRFAGNQRMIEAAETRITMMRHPEGIPTFDQWKRSQVV